MTHVTIHCRDLEKSIAFYERIVGLKIMRDLRVYKNPILFLGKEESGTKVELIEDKEHFFTGSGISIGFSVGNVEEKREELLEKGLEVTGLIRPNPVTVFFFVTDPDGMKVQFING